jgi:hypothetical protein
MLSVRWGPTVVGRAIAVVVGSMEARGREGRGA